MRKKEEDVIFEYSITAWMDNRFAAYRRSFNTGRARTFVQSELRWFLKGAGIEDQESVIRDRSYNIRSNSVATLQTRNF